MFSLLRLFPLCFWLSCLPANLSRCHVKLFQKKLFSSPFQAQCHCQRSSRVTVATYMHSFSHYSWLGPCGSLRPQALCQLASLVFLSHRQSVFGAEGLLWQIKCGVISFLFCLFIKDIFILISSFVFELIWTAFWANHCTMIFHISCHKLSFISVTNSALVTLCCIIFILN